MQGKKVSVGSLLEGMLGERASVREPIGWTLPQHQQQDSDSRGRVNSETPRQPVSLPEAARLSSISPPTMHNSIALNAIRTVPVAQRVLVAMKSVSQAAARGIRRRRLAEALR
jgi:hypothetical protein